MYKELEQYSLNAWPALQTFVYEGWLLRFAEGYTKRANSINPIYAGDNSRLDDKISDCERYYAAAGQQTIFKITPFCQPEDLDQVLDARGYALLEPSSVRVLTDLEQLESPAMAHIDVFDQPTAYWLETYAAIGGDSPATISIIARLMADSFLQKGFFILYADSKPVACGIAVIEQQWMSLYNFVTTANERNKGYGRQLLLHILHWAKRKGAKQAFLLVIQSNAAAIHLYSKLGFQEVYSYWYRVKPSPLTL